MRSNKSWNLLKPRFLLYLIPISLSKVQNPLQWSIKTDHIVCNYTADLKHVPFKLYLQGIYAKADRHCLKSISGEKARLNTVIPLQQKVDMLYIYNQDLISISKRVFRTSTNTGHRNLMNVLIQSFCLKKWFQQQSELRLRIISAEGWKGFFFLLSCYWQEFVGVVKEMRFVESAVAKIQ